MVEADGKVHDCGQGKHDRSAAGQRVDHHGSRDRVIKKPAAGKWAKPCIKCGRGFSPSRPHFDVCQSCYMRSVHQRRRDLARIEAEYAGRDVIAGNVPE